MCDPRDRLPGLLVLCEHMDVWLRTARCVGAYRPDLCELADFVAACVYETARDAKLRPGQEERCYGQIGTLHPWYKPRNS